MAQEDEGSAFSKPGMPLYWDLGKGTWTSEQEPSRSTESSMEQAVAAVVEGMWQVEHPDEIDGDRQTIKRRFRREDASDPDKIANLLRSFRAAGIEPHPYGEEADEQFSHKLAIPREDRTTPTMQDPEMLFEDNARSTTLTPESTVAPQAFFGINNPQCYFAPKSSSEERNAYKFGDPEDVVADIARMGGGTVRHINDPDLCWAHMFEADEDEIPAPDVLYEWLTDELYEPFSKFTAFLIICAINGVRVIPILFDAGGGSRLNNDTAVYDDGSTNPPTNGDVSDGRPSHQPGIVVPAFQGWSSFYWNFGDCWRLTEQALYQRYALNVYMPDDDPEMDQDAVAYMQECARRKSLAIAAFGKGVGEYLAHLASVAAEYLDSDITDLIPYVEVANELDSFWRGGTDSAREAGRFLALLTGPIHEAFSDARFRFADLIMHYAEDVENAEEDWRADTEWLKEVLEVGLEEEVQRWNDSFTIPNYLDDPDAWETFTAWASSAQAAGFQWPSENKTYRTRNLVHQVGFHHFRHFDYPHDAYDDETALGTAIDQFVDEAVAGIRPEVRVSWTLSAVSFQADEPEVKTTGGTGSSAENEHYRGGSPGFQAGMLARRLLYARSFACTVGGPDFVLWYTFMSGVAMYDVGWTQFTGTGVRNELLSETVNSTTEWYLYGTKIEEFTQGIHAWRRPAWFSYRRVCWLCSKTKRYELLFQRFKMVLLRLTAQDLYSDPEIFHVARKYTHAYVAWLDETSTVLKAQFSISERERSPSRDSTILGLDYKLVPLVPKVDYGGLILGDTDENGYPAKESVTWTTETTTSSVEPIVGGIRVTVMRGSETNKAPICIFTNAKMVGEVTMGTIVSQPPIQVTVHP